jgi:DNA-binding NarL/FixJ family response regulator
LTEALADLIGEEPGLNIVGIAPDDEQAIALARRIEPDVLLVDLEARDCDAERVSRAISKELPRISLVALSGHDDQETVQRVLEAGFRRHVSKVSGVPSLLSVLLEDHVFLD